MENSNPHEDMMPELDEETVDVSPVDEKTVEAATSSPRRTTRKKKRTAKKKRVARPRSADAQNASPSKQPTPPPGYTAHVVYLREQEVQFIHWVTQNEQRVRMTDWSFADTIEMLLRQKKNENNEFKIARNPQAQSGRASTFNSVLGGFEI